ncbi:hypothetical protein ACO0K2_15360 [Undibacterium sp. MH2W]
MNDVEDEYVGARGFLDEYAVDGDKSYGLFIDLLDRAVFVDIKIDRLFKK